jgi:hypothetical protein
MSERPRAVDQRSQGRKQDDCEKRLIHSPSPNPERSEGSMEQRRDACREAPTQVQAPEARAARMLH